MADVVTQQDLVDAKQDAAALEVAVNGDENTDVTARLGRKYPTLAKAVYEVIKAGGFEPFLTEVELLASVPDVPKKAAKALDTRKIWYWGGASWADTGLSDVDVSRHYTDNKMLDVADYVSKNKYNPALAVEGLRVSGTGALNVVAGAKHTGHIPVQAGKTYTMSWSNTVSEIPFYSFFALSTDASNPISFSIAGSTASPQSFTVPTGANFVVINLKHSTTATERTNFQLEEGIAATAYEQYNPVAKPNKSFSSDLVKISELGEIVEPMLQRGYENISVSRNLFNEDDVQADKFLSVTDGSINSSAGWKISGLIPVVAGKKYTLSGERSRQGISFFSASAPGTSGALYYNNSLDMPITVTAPPDSKYAVVALESATSKGWSNIQFEEGDAATDYIKYGETKITINAEYIDGIDELIIGTKASAKVVLNNGVGVMSFGELDIGVKIFNSVTYTGSAVFNFNNDSCSGQQIRLNGDDAAPVRMMGATIGANHGYSITGATVASHGKTNIDVGSVWSDGVKEWVITRIVSSNVIDFTCRSENIALKSGALTHISGAQNTGAITVTAVTARQWYPMLKNHKIGLSLDGRTNNNMSLNANFNDNLKISESYDLMEKSDIVEWLIQNGGKEVKSYNAPSALNVSHVHSFDVEGGDTIYANFFTYKNLSAAQDLMFTQAARLKVGENGAIKYYVPRSVAFTHESVNYDFSTPTDVDNLTITTRINFDAAKTEPGKAVPDRLIMMNNDVGFAIGYLPVLDAAPDVRNSLTTKGIQISNSEAKVYPYLVDGLTELEAGASYSAICYRKYFKRTPGRTCEYIVSSDIGDFLFLDWHSVGKTDVIYLQEKLIGRSFSVIDKTDNVELLSAVATNSIAVKISSTKSYGYLVIKFI